MCDVLMVECKCPGEKVIKYGVCDKCHKKESKVNLLFLILLIIASTSGCVKNVGIEKKLEDCQELVRVLQSDLNMKNDRLRKFNQLKEDGNLR